MKTYVGLLRGINVGGKNKLTMDRLVAHFQEAGGAHVSTYIQSGNVLFDAASATRAQSIVDGVVSLLLEHEGLDVPVIVRSLSALEKSLESHPFLVDEDDERMVSIAFLADRPTNSSVSQLDSQRSPGDRFLLAGQDIYLHTPQGMGRSKLSVSYFDRTLRTTTTVRNLKTVRALVALGAKDLC